MKKLTISMILAALAVGCGDDDRPGSIMLPDSGPNVDMGGGGTDMGTGGTDMGTGPRECAAETPDLRELNMDPMAMGMLLPRCAAATQDCINACDAMDAECPTNCTDADTTPGVDVGGGTTLDCSFCYNYQFVACLDASCHDQVAAVNCCAEDNPSCTDVSTCPECQTEWMALLSCARPILGTCPDFQNACFDS